MNKLIATTISMAIASLIATPVFSAGKGATPNGKPFIEIAGQILEVEGEIASLQDQVDSLVARVDTVEERVGAINDAISGLETKNAELQVLIDAYGSDITALQGEVQALKNVNAELQVAVDAGDATLQGQIDENAAMITTLNQSIADMGNLQAQIGNNLALINAMQDEVASFNTLLELKQNVIDGVCPAGSAIRAINDNGSVECEVDTVATGGSSGISEVRVQNYALSPQQYYPGYGYYYSEAVAYATCPVGYSLTGGGAYQGHHSFGYSSPHWGGNSAGMTVPYSNYDTRTWRAASYNGSQFQALVWAYAICIKHL